jgi:hypothetical protein
MNPISSPRGEPLQLTEEEEAAVASAKAALRRRNGRGRDSRELSLATLTVVGGLSLGAVAGLAYLSGDARVPWLSAAVSGSGPASQPARGRAPIADKAAEASVPSLVKAASAAPAEAKPQVSREAVAPAAGQAEAKPSASAPAAPAPRPRLEEPIQTASISPAVRLPPMTLLPPAEPIAKSPEKKPVEVKPAEAKPAEPAASPRPPAAQARPTVSPAEAEGYLAKAEAALRGGDLIVARSFFDRLAQAGDPRGALGMARTYDEAELRKLPVYGLKPDPAEAERWRLRAREMTSAVARN